MSWNCTFPTTPVVLPVSVSVLWRTRSATATVSDNRFATISMFAPMSVAALPDLFDVGYVPAQAAHLGHQLPDLAGAPQGVLDEPFDEPRVLAAGVGQSLLRLSQGRREVTNVTGNGCSRH